MAKIGAPVGAGKTAVNDPKDVATVQKLLGNHADSVGYKSPRTSGKIDQPTILAIGQFQKEVVGTKVTSLVEPGSKTLKMLEMPARKVADIVAKAKGGTPLSQIKGKVYQVKWQGKTLYFTEDDMGTAISAIQSRLHTETMAFMDTLRNYQDRYREMKQGVTTFFVMMVTPDADIERPAKSLKSASAAVSKLVNMTYGKNKKGLLASFKQMHQTKIALDAAASDINILANELGTSAKICEEMAVDLRDGAFDIVQLILVANGVNPTAAGAGVAASKNIVQEIANGVILKGQWVKAGGVSGSLKRVGFATVAGGFSAWLGAKAGQLIIGKVGEKLITRMTSARWIGKYYEATAKRWIGKEVTDLLGNSELGRKGAEVVIQTLIRMAHKLFTGRAISKALTASMAELEKIVSGCMDKTKAEGQLIDCIAASLERKGFLDRIADDILSSKKKEILRQIEADLARA